jgi:hypothetical protein
VRVRRFQLAVALRALGRKFVTRATQFIARVSLARLKIRRNAPGVVYPASRYYTASVGDALSLSPPSFQNVILFRELI